MLEPRQYAEWLHGEVFLPVVVVIGSNAAKARIREANGLSVAELFAPFGGMFQGISVTVQSLERQIHIENVRFRFADADTAVQPSAAQADQLSSWMVESSASKGAGREPEQALEPPSPWYEQWRSSIFRALRWSEHEGLDQPAAALLVLLSKEPDPVSIIDQLLHSSNMPPLCTQGVLDPVPARTAVLLHDLSDPESPTQEELAAKLEQVKAHVTPHLALAVQISRGGADSVEPEIEDIFRQFAAARNAPPPPPVPNEAPKAKTAPGARLIQEDLRSLAYVGSQVVVKTAVPWLERQLQQLEAHISQSRKGFKNQLKYLWRKPREGESEKSATSTRDTRSEEAGSVYSFNTVEGQMRLAGDIAFHLRDYETALGYYRSVVSDFKQDKSHKHAAGVYEMWGVCTYVTRAAKSEWSRCMEMAYDYYLQAGGPASTRYAMRTVALHQAMLCDFQEAAARLMKVNGDIADNVLRSALVLEQAGQLYCQAGQMRKGAFHIVLAGHTFNKLNLKHLALNCYQAVVKQYAGKQWFHINDHFHLHMARQAFSQGKKTDAISFFIGLLNSFSCPDRKVNMTPERESQYLKEFLFVMNDSVKEGGAQKVDLNLPCLEPDVRVTVEGDGTSNTEQTSKTPALLPASGEEAVAPAPKMTWEALAEKILPSLSAEDRLELQWRHSQDHRIFDSLRRVTAVGSEVKVELSLSNPMKVPLDVTGVRLQGKLQTGTLLDGESSGEVDFVSQDISLRPQETRKLKLVAVPRTEGLLSITEVAWNLGDKVVCERPLVVKGRRLRSTLEQRAKPEGVYSTDLRLELKVRSCMPRLSARLEGWPRQSAVDSSPPGVLLQGEICKCNLVISGEAGALPNSLLIATSHPHFIAFQVPATSGDELRVELRDGMITIDGDLSWLRTSPDGLQVPLLIRAESVGCHDLRICLLAEVAEDSRPKSERRQWITLEEQLLVQPGLTLSARPSPSYRIKDKMLFTCSLENRAAESLELKAMHCFMGSEELELQECGSQEAGKRVEQGQMAQFLFALQRPAAAVGPAAAVPVRQQLLAASRTVLEAAAPQTSGSSSSRSGRHASRATSVVAATMDLVAEWQTGERSGEAFALRVPLERPEAAPCPLDLQLLAPESAVFASPLMVPVALSIRNASSDGPVSFYYVAEPAPEVTWLGCERSEIISLPPQAVHSSTLQAYFAATGVFNLNRFRVFVVSTPPGASVVHPASEQAPLAFTFPFECLIHVVKPESTQTVATVDLLS
eukprot:TRINITY_DN30978_c0_g1_i1.p1 TRINITY_DN30978_c0_g1~~TRINITY_DN30978_c0_g1_i1.p1  ORF type:complete len:1250 (-),score=256.79 TRINITY_DN30978_c0_g1_i1:160-3909(-)